MTDSASSDMTVYRDLTPCCAKLHPVSIPMSTISCGLCGDGSKCRFGNSGEFGDSAESAKRNEITSSSATQSHEAAGLSILAKPGIVRKFHRELEMQTECSAMFDARCPDASDEDMDYTDAFEASEDSLKWAKQNIDDIRKELISRIVDRSIEMDKPGRLRPSIEYTVKDIFTDAGDNRFHVFEVRSGQA